LEGQQLTLDRLEAMRATSVATVLDEVRGENPLLISGGPGLSW